MKLKKFLIAVIFTFIIWGLTGPVWAVQKIDIDVKTVLASYGPKFADPILTAIVQELQSIFRYSSYQLLSQNSMCLGIGETGTAPLAGNRVLKITVLGIVVEERESRAELRLVIFKKRRRIFQTVIHLLNHASIIVGGPKHKEGFLLFNIYGSF